MALKYYIEFESVNLQTVRAEISSPSFSGTPTNLHTTIDQPVTIEQAGSGELYGTIGTAAKIRFIQEGQFDEADFIVNNYTDLSCEIFVAGSLVFSGFIVVDDITHEYRVTPYIVELTFTDNIALLSDIEAPFTIDEGFTTLQDVMQRILALTGLSFDLRVFFLPREIGNTDNARQFEETKIVPRSWMNNVSEFKKAKEMLDDLLTTLRCRLYQLNGEWVIFRLADYIYNGPSTTYTGARYAAVGGAYSADSIECDISNALIPIQFSQTVTNKRPLVSVADTYKLEQLPGIWNADLKELGALISTSTVGNVRTDKYTPPFWTTVGAGYAGIAIVILTDTTTELEFDRYFEIPANVENTGTANGVLFNPILISAGDKFQMTARVRSDTDTNFATYFSVGVLLKGVSGLNYQLIPIFQATENVWQQVLQDETTLLTTSNGLGLRGRDDLTQYADWAVALEAASGINIGMDPCPEDGVLYVKIGGFKDNRSNSVAKICWLKDIEFQAEFFVNNSILIDAHRHTATNDVDSLNIEEKELKCDDSGKYSSSGALYNTDNENTTVWRKFAADDSPVKLGELNTTNQIVMQGDGRRQVSGIFYGSYSFNQYATFGSGRFAPIRLLYDLHRLQVAGDWIELADGTLENYTFEYLYKNTR